ncbi:FtsX-like permease family protein [Acaryochloris marina]|uniref:DevC protein, putative n=1 Tax=Acaryochloris marina (strain MBIC 11017) TaxID=329726 RepID=B0C5K4_ACAM1|nr:FtsX-like permease family protein [Acaryochloris marina]ABW27580.1 DevC protein, putative [Acaryochloris marina MBIC11017]BDM82316.1 ABC transporter [Acaryochloris marina MBIC10699]
MKWGRLRNLTAERPLAWAQLSHQKARLAVALTGVAFANILMFAQLGIRAVLFDGITLIHENLQGELFLISSYSRALGFQAFARIYLYQANSVPGVASARPLYILGRVDWINPEQLPDEHPIPPELLSPPGQGESADKEIQIFPDRVKILAFNLSQPAFTLPEINQQLDKLKEPDSILFDRLSQDGLGPISDLITQKPQLTTVMGNRRTQIAGLFTLGSTLFTKGHVIMSDLNYAARNGPESLENVSVGLVSLDAGADPLQVKAQIQQALPPSIQVLTREELIQKEVAFWETDPSGTVLNFGAMMGFVVGVIVVYQVLYSDVLEHLPEYATLKAMGFADNALLRVVLQEAMILAVLGFVPGCVASVGVYSLLSSLTKIPLSLRPDVMAQVFILTIVMCMGAGGIATQKLRQADPADVF